MKKLYSIVIVALFTLSLFAQVPQKMSYQAAIRNTLGELVKNSPVGMRISILQTSATGAEVYVETQSPVTNVNGLATFEIGAGTVVTGTFAGIDWSTGVYFLKTETDPTGGTSYTISGTSQLLSVPYALYAKTSETSPELESLKKFVYSQFPPSTSGLIAYYPFTGNANDESGNVNNGTVFESILTSDRFGKNSSAYSFDGVNDYIEIQPSTTINTAAMDKISISAWVNPNNYNPYDRVMSISNSTDIYNIEFNVV